MTAQMEGLTMKKRIWILAVVGAVLMCAAPVLADGDLYVIAGGSGVGTKISSLPYTITAPGFYYLTKNLTSTGNGIVVNANNVTIDLMGFTMTGPGTSSSYGIYIYNQRYVQIRNGTVTNFYNGIYAETSSNAGHRVSNLYAVYNTHFGIWLGGDDHVIQNSNVSWNGADGIESIGMVSNVIASKNGGTGIGNRGLITNCMASANQGTGIANTSSPFFGTMLNNISYNNTGYGFSVGSTAMVDRNTAYSNTLGNYTAGDASTVWGLNAGR
jgi:hypothetical protein